MARVASVLVLGVSFVVLAGVLPVAARQGEWLGGLVLLPIAPLVMGVALLAARRSAMASAVLLVGVPAGLMVWLVATDVRLESFGIAGLAGACAALIGFGLASMQAVSASDALAQVTEKGLAGAAPTSDDGARRWLGRAWIALGGLMSVALVVVAPSLGTRAELRRAYGESAPDVEALVAVAGSAAALLVVGVAIAGSMRRTRRDGSLPRPRRARTLAWLGIALVAIVLVVIRRMG